MAPDYAPRPAAGPGRMANRQDLSDGRHAGPGTTPITGAPTVGTGAPYGQRAELEQLQRQAPTATGAPPRAGAPSPSSFPELAPASQDAPLPPLAPVPDQVLAAYDPAAVQHLLEMLPDVQEVAAQPDAGPAITEFAELLAEIALAVTPRTPPPAWIGPSPERAGPVGGG
jgi:hypothetical protein